VLEVTDLTRAYGRGEAAHLAIDRVSLNVSRGELVSIVGPSGCGKSTLLRCVGGLIRPTAGRVVLRGEPVEQVPDGLAVVFQDYGRSLYPWLTVRDNVALPLRRTTRARAARRQAADAALAAVGLAGAGGMRGVPVSLPEPRDQITTKELPEFVRLRTEVSRLVRSRDAVVLPLSGPPLSWSPAYQAHVVFVVTVAVHADPRCRAVEVGDLVGGQRHLGRGGVLGQPLTPPGARDRHDLPVLSEQPGQRDLPRRGPPGPRERRDVLD
jgi:hypothetical protein